jgi:MerR family transcriptional regulator, heat shock protein HspR
MRDVDQRPIYTIGVVSDLLEVHPETIRVWERHDIIKPQRRSGKRFYSETDLKRLRFIKKLMTEGLNLPAVRHYLSLYPCWKMDTCPTCMHQSELASCSKPCWKDDGLFCQVYGKEEVCAICEYCKN